MNRRSSMMAVWTLVGLAVVTFLGPRVVAQWAVDDSMVEEDLILGGSEPFLGQIQTFGFNFAPRGWAKCDGQLMQISQNTALFSLLGTTYGGDGRTTFGLPDLRGRAPIHMGRGPGLTDRRIGSRAGAETVTLTVNQMPAHNHQVFVLNENGDSRSPVGNVSAMSPLPNDVVCTCQDDQYGPLPESPEDTMDADTVSQVGGSQAHANMQPFLTINYCIALQGVFPSRN